MAQYGEMALGLIEHLTDVVEILFRRLGVGPLLAAVEDRGGSPER